MNKRFAKRAAACAVICVVVGSAFAAEPTAPATPPPDKPAASGRAAKAPPVPPPGFDAKVTYCKTCHGSEGQGYRGATPIPRLAGQQTEYFQVQLKAFVDKRRENKFMYNVAHVLSPEMLASLAYYFANLNPKPLGGGNHALAAEGKKIFTEGLAAHDVPPCATCHGEDAKGNGPFPRLAGQLHDYIVGSLTGWDKIRGQDPKNQDNSAMMAPIAHNLTQAQISAVAAYLSSLN